MVKIARASFYGRLLVLAMLLVPVAVVLLQVAIFGFGSVDRMTWVRIGIVVVTNGCLGAWAFTRIARNEQRLIGLLEAKEKLVAMVSHDLKAPLSSIIMAADTLVDDPAVAGPRVAIIKRQSTAMLALINDLLLSAAAQLGRLELKYTEVLVRDLVNDVLTLMSLTIEQKGIHVVTILDGEKMCCDPNRVKQILINLITNSVKYTPAGGSITISCGYRNEQTFFVVEDTGCGIPQDKLKRIFEPFEKGQYATGHGLGLHIVKSLVEAHNGVVWAESITGKGSSISFTIGPASKKKS